MIKEGSMYSTILFDLDGTLTDPGVGITNSVAYALNKWGIPVEDRASLYPFIGPPLKDSFMKYYGFSKEQALQSVEYYREYFREKGLFENDLFTDTAWILKELRNRGKTIILATSKPEEFALTILRHFEILEYFDLVAGATMDETRNKKADVIAYALKTAGVTDVSSAIMVGDREHDVLGARQNGLSCIGVLFGYGSRKELEDAGAVCIAESFKDVLEYIEA